MYFLKSFWRATYVLGLSCLPACSNDELSTRKVGPPQEPIPLYKPIIAKEFASKFKDSESYRPLQISDSQLVNSFRG